MPVTSSRDFRIAGRMGFLHAVRLRGDGDRSAYQAKPPIGALRRFPVWVGEHGRLAHTARQRQKQHKYSDFHFDALRGCFCYRHSLRSLERGV